MGGGSNMPRNLSDTNRSRNMVIQFNNTQSSFDTRQLRTATQYQDTAPSIISPKDAQAQGQSELSKSQPPKTATTQEVRLKSNINVKKIELNDQRNYHAANIELVNKNIAKILEPKKFEVKKDSVKKE